MRLPGYEFDPEDVSPRATFVVMPLCDQGDVRAEMKRLYRAGEFFAEARVRAILTQLLSVVQHLKAHRIVHRDIKADNVMLQSAPGGAERVVLIDFGQCWTARCTSSTVSRCRCRSPTRAVGRRGSSLRRS